MTGPTSTGTRRLDEPLGVLAPEHLELRREGPTMRVPGVPAGIRCFATKTGDALENRA